MAKGYIKGERFDTHVRSDYPHNPKNNRTYRI